MKKFRRAKLLANNGSVVVYYSRAGIMKYPTGVAINKMVRNKKLVEWDYQDNQIKANVQDYHIKNIQITKILNRANKLLESTTLRAISLPRIPLAKVLSA